MSAPALRRGGDAPPRLGAAVSAGDGAPYQVMLRRLG